MSVELYLSPWVSGTRAAASFGPIHSEVFVVEELVRDRENEWLLAEEELLDLLARRAECLGANAIVGLELEADPFAEIGVLRGLRLHATGTAAKLEPLWG